MRARETVTYMSKHEFQVAIHAFHLVTICIFMDNPMSRLAMMRFSRAEECVALEAQSRLPDAQGPLGKGLVYLHRGLCGRHSEICVGIGNPLIYVSVDALLDTASITALSERTSNSCPWTLFQSRFGRVTTLRDTMDCFL